MRDDGRAFRLSKNPSSVEESSNGETCRFPNLLATSREHNDKPKQIRKRKVKLKWLIINIPKIGEMAKEILTASK